MKNIRTFEGFFTKNSNLISESLVKKYIRKIGTNYVLTEEQKQKLIKNTGYNLENSDFSTDSSSYNITDGEYVITTNQLPERVKSQVLRWFSEP
jgi:hypothetical protein